MGGLESKGALNGEFCTERPPDSSDPFIPHKPVAPLHSPVVPLLPPIPPRLRITSGQDLSGIDSYYQEFDSVNDGRNIGPVTFPIHKISTITNCVSEPTIMDDIQNYLTDSEDDYFSDWDSPVHENGKSSIDEKTLFQRVDSRPNLTPRRSLLTTMLHQSDCAATLVDSALKAMPILQQRPNSSPQDLSPAASLDSDDSPPLMMRGKTQNQGMQRPIVQPIAMTTKATNSAALSPEMSRRNVLQTELTGSLRRHLLWERQQKNLQNNTIHALSDIAKEYVLADSQDLLGKECRQPSSCNSNAGLRDYLPPAMEQIFLPSEASRSSLDSKVPSTSYSSNQQYCLSPQSDDSASFQLGYPRPPPSPDYNNNYQHSTVDEKGPLVNPVSPSQSKPTLKLDGEVKENNNSLYYCNWPTCTEECRVFGGRLQWRRHMDKHERPYICTEKSCNGLVHFTYLGGLLQHHREVHRQSGDLRKNGMCFRPPSTKVSGRCLQRRENLNNTIRRVPSAFGLKDNFKVQRNSQEPQGGLHDKDPTKHNTSFNKSPESSETAAVTDDSLTVENSAAISGIETDWEEGEGGRDKIYREILISYSVWRLSNSQVRQLRSERHLEDPKKQRLIDDLMVEFYEIINGLGAENRTCTGGQGSSSKNAEQTTAPAVENFSFNGTGIKRNMDDDEDIPGEDEDDHPSKRPKCLTKPIGDRLESKKFACPFHQHNPRKYGVNLRSNDADYRSCAGPGWKSVARIKEHLYRRHRVPIKCSRCSELFKHDNDLKSHLREQLPCEVRPEEPVEGVTAEIERKLKSRKKTRPNQSEEDRWREVYRILFPNEDIASPYYEDDDSIALFEEYSRREMPRVFLSLLEGRASTNQLSREMRDELIDVIQECRRYVYLRFRQDSHEAHAPPGPAPPSPAPPDPAPIPDLVHRTMSPDFSSSDNTNASHPIPVEPDMIDTSDFDPNDFQSLFLGNHLLDLDSFTVDHSTVPDEKMCYCSGACSCPPSSTFSSHLPWAGPRALGL